MEEEEEGEKKVVDEEEKDAKMKMARSINGILVYRGYFNVEN